MKISTSSSIFLTTLAISSSSSSLAAPAGDFEDVGLSASPSMHSMHHCHPLSAIPTPTSMAMDGRSDTVVGRSFPVDSALSSSDAAQDTPGDTIGIVGAILQPLIKKLSVVEQGGTQSGNISEQDMAALASAVGEVNRMLSQTPPNAPVSPPAPVQNATSPITNPQSVGEDPSSPSKSSSYFPARTEAATAEAGPNAPTTTTYYSSASASPSIPNNPPNTPSLPLPATQPSLPTSH